MVSVATPSTEGGIIDCQIGRNVVFMYCGSYTVVLQ